MAVTGELSETFRWLILAPDWYAVVVALTVLGLGLGLTYHFKRDLDEWTIHDWGFVVTAAAYTYVRNACKYEEVKKQLRPGHLPEEADNHDYRSISKEAVKAPSISHLKFIHGALVQLGKGQFTIIFFWSPADKGLRTILAFLNAVARRNCGEKLQVLGVSNTDDESVVQGYIKMWNRRFDISVAIDPGLPQTENDHHDTEFLSEIYAAQQGVSDAYFPFAYIVGKEGFIRWNEHLAHCERELYKLMDRTAGL